MNVLNDQNNELQSMIAKLIQEGGSDPALVNQIKNKVDDMKGVLGTLDHDAVSDPHTQLHQMIGKTRDSLGGINNALSTFPVNVEALGAYSSNLKNTVSLMHTISGFPSPDYPSTHGDTKADAAKLSNLNTELQGMIAKLAQEGGMTQH